MMKKKSDKLNLPDSQAGLKVKKTLRDDPIFPDGDFIFEDIHKEDKDPDNPSPAKEPNSNNALAPISFTQFLKNSEYDR
jgi:hypothetical protein